MHNDLHQIEQRVLELYKIAEFFFQKKFKRPYIRLDLSGKAAGQAWLGKNQLRFNKTLLQENREHFIEQTVAHEVCHLLTHELFGSRVRPHGREWQEIMVNVFKLPPERCHCYDTGSSSQRKWLYQCHCEGKIINLSTIRHNRSQHGVIYLCNHCKAPLKFLGKA